MSGALDPNLNPFRPEIAASHLQGQVEAARFVDGTAFQVTGGLASLRREAREDGEQLSQALHGDIIDIYEEVHGFGWGQMRSDGYVGWFDMAALSSPVLPVTRKIAALRTYSFCEPNFKAPPHFLLSLGARVCETGQAQNGFVKCARAGWVYEPHLAQLDQYVSDPVSVALKFLEAPYQWGGVESLGLDCSGLVQTSFKAAGIFLPRDAYMLIDIGVEIGNQHQRRDLKRGDIVCWPGHVAIMTNDVDIIHANSFHLQVTLENLELAVARISSLHGPIVSIRRSISLPE